VETHLLPRLNGFELLMASYAMAHLQMDLLLTETGFKPTKNDRFRIYLTNSLEESHPDTGTLFANWLSSEANEANHIKRDSPVMCVIGNPPYAVSSTNKGKWIENLSADYKKDLNERNIQPLSDDYIKFIRYGQHFIDKNGSGVLAYISNNSFIDGIIHRQMRKNLLESFDKIYILDLHGNARKKEVCIDGSADNNVFDIMQGVSINVFIKTGKKNKNELGQVFQFDLQGKRDFKYDYLSVNSLQSIKWNIINAVEPNYFLIKKNNEDLKLFNSYIDLRSLFILNSMGIASGNDDELVSFDKKLIENKYNSATKFYYRPFDIRYTIFDNSILQRARYKLMNNYILGKNLGLNIVRQSKLKGIEALISDNLTNRDFITNHTYNFPLYTYPEKTGQLSLHENQERTPNLNMEIVKEIADKLGIYFSPEKPDYNLQTEETNQFYPIDILDYIYAVLHSPTYREKYKEFLKIDFPRIPYPKDAKTFWELVELGSQIRQIHLLESAKVEDYITEFPIDGDCIVTKPKFEPNLVKVQNLDKVNSETEPTNSEPNLVKVQNLDKVNSETEPTKSEPNLVKVQNLDKVNSKTESTNDEIASSLAMTGRVYINETQYFDHVPEIAWNFYIGGYQPAQKWLKDRKDRKLEFEDIAHYQKIIVALAETDRLMKKIDGIEIED
jgi:predicted helicase